MGPVRKLTAKTVDGRTYVVDFVDAEARVSVSQTTVTVDRSLRALQKRQLAWVEHNFPTQLQTVRPEDVQAVIDDPEFSRYSVADAIAEAIAYRDPRIVKNPLHGLLGTVEELGELAGAVLKAEQGIRSGTSAAESKERVEDAVADLVIFLTSFCNTRKIDLESVVWNTWEQEVEPRDWVKFPKDGRTK